MHDTLADLNRARQTRGPPPENRRALVLEAIAGPGVAARFSLGPTTTRDDLEHLPAADGPALSPSRAPLTAHVSRGRRHGTSVLKTTTSILPNALGPQLALKV